MLADRTRLLNTKSFNEKGTYVVYWMQAAQRIHDNHALAYALELANKHRKQLVVCFGIAAYPGAQRAHYQFMLEGLLELCDSFDKLGIEFVVKQENPVNLALSFDSCCIIVDENYTRTPRSWREKLGKESPVQVWVVDTNLIVPAALLGKEEWAAYTIRPKLWAQAQKFLAEVKLPKYHAAQQTQNKLPKFTLDVDDKAVAKQKGGEKQARDTLKSFLKNITQYEQRNDASVHATSKLSPYLHFGMISPITVVQEASAAATPKSEAAVNSFIEQVFVRREVAHNFTYYNKDYDNVNGFADWAKKTLEKHSADKRDYIYTYKELEAGKTHDELWNAAQLEMVRSGYMHNYLRMLWAKKILEWTNNPQEAMDYAIKLNDKYELDGRDPNGYTGIAWSIGGKHDRPWFERNIYGQVRYMSTTAAAKKFNAEKYIQYVNTLQ